MAIRTSVFSPKGVSRDLTRSKFSPDSLYDAYNIRFTARGSNKTLLSISNERGNKKTVLTGNVISGVYLGHCVINSYLTLFTKNGSLDNIYKVDFSTNVCTRLYSGNLGFSTDSPIETLGIYEKADVIKVYWIDGINQPRVINIMGDYSSRTNNPFDFVQTLSGNENVTVTKNLDSNGTFKSGTIQYACTYLSMYGQETDLFYLSDINYIAFKDRGASPEQSVNCQFKITITSPDTNFDYIRVYSIHRTSQNGTPEVKRVVDLANTKTSISYIDTGVDGEIISTTYLNYSGGESITASAITLKDNTLFLGNITLNQKGISDTVKESLKAEVAPTLYFSTKLSQFPVNDSSLYEYTSTLKGNANITFKGGETYRFGLVFKYKTGKYSEVCYLKDLQNTLYPGVSGTSVTLSQCKCVIPQSISSVLMSEGFISVMPVCVYPDINNRSVIAQGVVNPTIYDVKKRLSNEPFSYASPFFRPMKPSEVVASDNKVGTLGYNEFRHNYPIPEVAKGYRNAEFYFNNSSLNIYPGGNIEPTGSDGLSVFVDASICTMNSPEIEYDTDVQNMDLSNCKFRIVGYIPIEATLSDVDLQTETSPYYTDALGFMKGNYSSSGETGFSHLLTSPMYQDKFVSHRDWTQADLFNKNMCKFIVSPWQRSGSINNFGSVDSTITTKPCKLKYHKMSLLRYSNNTRYLSSSSRWSTSELSGIRIYNFSDTGMVKLPEPAGTLEGDIIYYGNVNEVLLPAERYNTYCTIGANTDDYVTYLSLLDSDEYPQLTTDQKSNQPISMKYKSVPHAVFAFNNVSGNQLVLPTIINGDKKVNSVDITGTSPFWYNRNTMYSGYRTIYVTYYEGSSGTAPVPNDSTESLVSYDGAAYHYYTVYTTHDDEHGVDNFSWTGDTPSNNTLLVVPTGQTTNTVLLYADSSYKVVSVPTTDYSVIQPAIDGTDIISQNRGFLWLGEFYIDNVSSRFGGDSEIALSNNKWESCGPSVKLSSNSIVNVTFNKGDTYYQRYDCLKTYPYTLEDENSVVDILSFMCETHVNIDGRYDRNRGQTNNLVMTPVNFGLMNDAYTQHDNYKGYNYLEPYYTKVDKFPNTITITEEKQNGAKHDIWTNITMASTLEMDGDKGKIISLNRFNNDVYCFQETGLSSILFNSRIQIPTSDNTPIQITNGLKLQGKIYLSDKVGCINKWSIIETPDGLYFIDNITNSLYRFDSKLTSLSDSLGMRTWVNDINSLSQWKPLSPGNMRGFYDKNNNDLYWSDSNYCISYSELLGQFTGFYSYEKIPAMFNINDDFYSFYPGSGYDYQTGDNIDTIWKMWDGDYNWFFGVGKPYWVTYIDNSMPLYDKIFDNLNFRLEAYSGDYYNSDSVEPVENYVPDKCFDRLDVHDEYQDGTIVLQENNNFGVISCPTLRKRFKVWRTIFPRDSSNGRDRIRNTWCTVKLSYGLNGKYSDGIDKYRIELHDMMVNYFL